MRKLNPESVTKDSDNYSKLNDKLDNIIDLMGSVLQELKKLNTYNDDKIKSQSLFNPFG